jgi:DNA-binding PadR family transcriptional regulator
LARQLESEELAERSMNYATLYRILDRLEHRGLLCCHPDEPGRYPGRPRRRFDLTRAGRALLRDLALAGAPNAQVAIIDGRLRFVGER